MTIRNMDGQMDFLGLITEYTDNQGAVVRVREPGKQRLKPITSMDCEQLSFEFGTTVTDAEPLPKPEPAVIIEEEEILPVPEDNDTSGEADGEPEMFMEQVILNEPDEDKEVEALQDFEPQEAITADDKHSSVDDMELSEPAPEPEKTEEEEEPADTEILEAIPPKVTEVLFKQCKKCWCFDCRHNSRNEGIPRELCGAMMACPACNDCISEDMATVCEIGNAKEGCRTRALEEGLIYEEEYTEG